MKALLTLLVLILSTLGVQGQRYHRPAKLGVSVTVRPIVSTNTVYTWKVDRSDSTDKGVLMKEVYVVTDRDYHVEVTLIPLDNVCVSTVVVGGVSFTRLDSPTPLSIYKRKDGKSTYKGTTAYVVLFQPTSVSDEAINNLLK